MDPIRKTPSSSLAANVALLADGISDDDEEADADASENDAVDEEADKAAALDEEKIVGFMFVAVVYGKYLGVLCGLPCRTGNGHGLKGW